MKLIPAVILASLIAVPAFARQDPQPKPSGIVIHLFGPGSITDRSSAPAAKDGGPAPESGAAASGTAASGTPASTAQAGQAATQGSASPTLGDVLHQMFVTGDPAQEAKPHFSPGRKAE